MYDIVYLRCLPNMVLMALKNEAELQQMVAGVNYTDGPCAIRAVTATCPSDGRRLGGSAHRQR